jgi:hypothetical protein
MRRAIRGAVILSIGIAFLGAVVYFIIFGSMAKCSDEKKLQLASNDGQYIATLSERNCGATTDFATVVTLREKQFWFFSKTTDMFFAEGRHSNAGVRWVGRRALQVSCLDCDGSRLIRRERQWRDVSVTYEVAAGH